MDRQKAQKMVDACVAELRKLGTQREGLQAELEATTAKRPELLRALAAGKNVANEITKLDAKAVEARQKLDGLELLVADSTEAHRQAQAVLSEILAEEAHEEQRRLLEQRRTAATQAADHVRMLFREFVQGRGELLVALVRLAELDKAGAQGIATSFTVYGTPGDPMRELLAAGWREVTAAGLHAAGPWTIPAMLPPDVEHPFPAGPNLIGGGRPGRT